MNENSNVVIDIPNEYFQHAENIQHLVKYFSRNLKRAGKRINRPNKTHSFKKSVHIKFPTIPRIVFCELCGRSNHENKNCYKTRGIVSCYKLCNRPSCFGLYHPHNSCPKEYIKQFYRIINK